MSFVRSFGYRYTAADGSGRFAARMASFLFVLAGIALAVSAVFFAVDVLVVRLLGVLIISLLLSVIVLIPATPARRKR